ncbi:MAG: hypothetical protein ACYDEO_29040 [Aggregatilineales bacterium]
MKRISLAAALVTFALALVALPLGSLAQGSDPASVFNAEVAALNAGDVSAANAAFADNGMAAIVGVEMFSGQKAIAAWNQEQVTQHFHIDAGTPQVTGNVVVGTVKVSNDNWTKLGVAPLDVNTQAVVTNGKILSLVVSLTPQSGAKLGAALAKAQATDPISIVSGFQAAENTPTTDAAAALLADDVVITIAPPAPNKNNVYNGKAAAQGWLSANVSQHFHADIAANYQIGPDSVLSVGRVSMDAWTKLGLNSLDAIAQIVVRDGKIEFLTITLTPQSGAKLGAALAKAGQ